MQVWKTMLRVFVQQQVVHREFWIVLFLNGVLPVVVPLLAWSALAESVQDLRIEGWTISTFTQYYVINFLVYSLSFTSVHHEIGSLVRTGQMNYWILRPLSFLEFALSYSVSRCIIMGVFSLAAALILQWSGITGFTLSQYALAATVMPLAVALLILMSICVGTLAFWLIECDGAFAAILLFLQFFGGLILPLDLFPEWLMPIARVMPLQYAFGLPADIIVHGKTTLITGVLAGQLLWCIALWIFASLLWKKGLRHYDAIGA